MATGLEALNPNIANILGGGAARQAARAASQRQPAATVDEEEERSLIRSLRDNSLTTVGAIGNFLDLPGSAVRDVGSMLATGKWVNPVDQFISPFSSENRTTGKDLLQQTGLAGGKESWGKSIGGFAAEMALDPLTYMTLGASALGKTGKLASKAGIADDAIRVATKKAGAAPGSIGAREARLTTNIADIAANSTGATRQRAQDLLKTLTPEEAAQPLGGMVGIGLPFMQPKAVFGTGPKSIAAAKGLDAAGRAIRFGKIPGTDVQNPVGAMLGLFDAPSGGAKTADVAFANQELFRNLPRSASAVRAAAANQSGFIDSLVKNPNKPEAIDVDQYVASRPWYAQADTPDAKFDAISDAIREGVEGVVPVDQLPESLRWIATQMREELEVMPRQMRKAGGRTYELLDDVDYAPRYASIGKKRRAGDDVDASTFDPSMGYRRLDFLRDIPGGTVAFKRQIAMDPQVRKLIEDKKGVDELAKYLRDTHEKVGNKGFIDDTYTGYYQSGKNKGKAYVKKGRFDAMAKMLYKQDPDVLKRGLFGNDIVYDHMARKMSHMKATSTLNNITDLLSSKDATGAARYIKPESEWASQGANIGAADDTTMSMQKFLATMDLPAYANHTDRKAGVDRKGGALRALGKKIGVPHKDLRNARIDKRIADDLIKIHKASSTRGPTDEILEMTDSFTNFTKSMLTSVWPSFHTRNLASGWAQNAMLGMWDKQTAKWAMQLQAGQALPDSRKVEWVASDYAKRARQAGWDAPTIEANIKAAGYDDAVAKKIAAEVGSKKAGKKNDWMFADPAKGQLAKLDDELATRLIGQRAYADGVIGSIDADRVGDVAGMPEVQSGMMREMLGGMPRPGFKTFSPFRTISKVFGREPGTTLNPLHSRGVAGRTATDFGPGAAGEEVGHFVEGLSRLQPYMALIKKGYDPKIAAEKVAAAQVAYSNRNFTPFELKYMRRLLPFFKFSRSQIPFQAKQLMQKPGGSQAQLVRGLNQAQSQGELAPDYVRDTASIPVSDQNPILKSIIGAAPEGTDRYLSGLGLMAEDLYSVGPGVRGTGQEFLSRLNPMVKGPLEYFTNQSFFQAGPEGGRPLDEMDPLIGRTIANLTGQKDAVKLPQILEVAAANSPISRFLTTARTLTDPRKRSTVSPVPLPGAAAAINLLTGARVTDVSPGSKDAIVRDLLTSRMKGAGARAFERVNFTKEDLAKMSPQERETALQLQGLANVLARRSKERAAERKKAEGN
jgi:hypothetical protein